METRSGQARNRNGGLRMSQKCGGVDGAPCIGKSDRTLVQKVPNKIGVLRLGVRRRQEQSK